jgi:hypothetical protein
MQQNTSQYNLGYFVVIVFNLIQIILLVKENKVKAAIWVDDNEDYKIGRPWLAIYGLFVLVSIFDLLTSIDSHSWLKSKFIYNKIFIYTWIYFDADLHGFTQILIIFK